MHRNKDMRIRISLYLEIRLDTVSANNAKTIHHRRGIILEIKLVALFGNTTMIAETAMLIF